MEFLSAFREPTVIISLSFSLLLFLFPTQGKKAGDRVLSKVGFLSGKVKVKIRVRRWGRNKKVIKTIRSPYEMQWQITRTYSLMLLFAVFITSYIILVAVGPLKGIGQLPVSVQYFIYSPVLALEALWLNQRENTKYLIKVAEERITRS
ncbi:hypothetical protein [Neptunomonas phycophila]|uniref:hypothetical protein n=1 Tax=Neptunomonas phycophila TaxID=1572645 RepID=UPI0015B7F49B|nr:hypothetical protein [Neptunomonas phycophila]QLE97463.1 hypothetical protein FLM49_07440 [Neptunomonas phycophila]